MSGVFEAYPKLKVILGHMGESLPFAAWRINQALGRSGRRVSFQDTFREHFWITTSGNFSTPALMCSLLELGLDRILFSIDWPMVPNKPGIDWMAQVPLCPDDKAKVLGGNACKLLKIDAPTIIEPVPEAA